MQYRKQDALDVLHGRFKLGSDTELTKHKQPHKAFLLVVVVVQLVFVAGQMGVMGAMGMVGRWRDTLTLVVTPFLIALLLLAVVLRDGDSYVCWPELMPEELAYPAPWDRASGRRGGARKAGSGGKKAGKGGGGGEVEGMRGKKVQ